MRDDSERTATGAPAPRTRFMFMRAKGVVSCRPTPLARVLELVRAGA